MAVDSLARRLAAAALQKGGSDVTKEYVDSELSKKYDKTGGAITGDVSITGNLTVSGTTTSESEKQLLVEANVIATNANKVDLKTLLSGLAINKSANATYGIMYDPTDDTVKFGEGTLSEDNKFVFKAGEGHPLAIRADSTKFIDAHLVKWDEATNSFVDAGFALEGGEAELSIQQPPAQESFINTIVGYVKNSTEENPVGKDAYGAYVDPSIYNATDNTTKVENNGERTTMLGGLSASIPATPTEVRPNWSGYGSQSFIHGKRIINVGDQNHVFGTDHLVYGDNSFVAGLRNVATNGEVTMLGTGLIGTRLWQVILGRYNKPSYSFFQIGGGKQVQHIDGTNPDGSNRYVLDSIERKNVLEIDEGGNAILAGRLNIGIEPAGEEDAVRLKELNEGLATKANLVPTPATGSILYGVPSSSATGQPQAYTTGTGIVTQYAIPQRAAGGQINMPDQTKAVPTDHQAITRIFGDTNYLSLAGGEISGGLSVVGDPVVDTDVARLKDLNAVKTTIGAIGDTNPPTLEKVIYCKESEIPANPETGVEYACTDLIGEADLDPTFINKVNSKQNLLTFDTAPTSGSTNPVTSGGIYDVISKFLTIQVSDSLIGG